jgi:hypothetical protein
MINQTTIQSLKHYRVYVQHHRSSSPVDGMNGGIVLTQERGDERLQVVCPSFKGQ